MKRIKRKGATRFLPQFQAAFFDVLFERESGMMERLQIKDIQTDGKITRIIVWK